MGDSSGASDSENLTLTSENSLCINSCTIATQTPELPRHVITTQTTDSLSRRSSFNDLDGTEGGARQGPSVVVLRVDKGFTEDFAKEAKALSIPDVVVEYIKDSYALTENSDAQQTIEFSATNLGFDSQEGLVKSASSTNLRLQEQDGASFNSQELRKCYSMPRNMTKKRLKDDFYQMQSQVSTPKMQRLKLGNDSNKLGTSSSLLGLYQPNGNGFVAPPSPNFGYRPFESETSAVYTIIKTCLNTNTVKEIHLLNNIPSSLPTTPGIKRKFEYAETTPPEIEKKQRWLQCCTDTCSAMFFIPGLLITILTPIIIIPMLMLPMSYFVVMILLFLGSGALGVVILTFSGFIGNLVWYYDANKKKMRLRLHCGRGPRLRFWGNGFYAWSDAKLEAKKQKELIV